MPMTFSESAGRYRDTRSGRFVSERSVRAVVDSIADGASDRMGRLAQELLDGSRSLGSFQAEMMREIKLSQLAAHTIARGGAAQMTPASYLAAARDIKEQYRYLRGMAADIASGRQPFNGSLVARARQYGQASRATFERTYGAGQQQRGFRFEANVLAPAEHCSECRELTALGWVPIGTLPPIGRRLCRSNDRCRIRYARTVEQAA